MCLHVLSAFFLLEKQQPKKNKERGRWLGVQIIKMSWHVDKLKCTIRDNYTNYTNCLQCCQSPLMQSHRDNCGWLAIIKAEDQHLK